MLSYAHNGAISMDATFGTNDMKFHLFTLMGFDDHCMSAPLVWIITSRQTIEDLIEWLKPLKDKMLSHMPHWTPSCFFTFTNISLVMHGQITSKLITINLVSDNVCHGLVFKTLL